MLARILIWPGLGLFISGTVVWLWPWGHTATENWSPVEIPVQLERGREIAARFTTDRSGTYWVMLRVYRDMPLEELQGVLGKSWFAGEGGEEPVLLPWEIRSGDVVVAVGSGRGNQGRCYSGNADVGASLGSFEAKEGQLYSISARVEQTVDGLLGHRTEFVVWADPMYFKNAMVGDFMRSAVGFMFMMVPGGFALLVGGVLWVRRRRRGEVDSA